MRSRRRVHASGVRRATVAGCAVLLAASCTWMGWVLAQGHYPPMLVLLPTAALCIRRLVRLYGDAIRRVTFMLDAIDNGDYNFRFCEQTPDRDNALLHTTLNRIREIMVRAKVRAEERERYYQLIMECARTGIVTVNDAGSIYQANSEVLRIFGLPVMTHASQLAPMAPAVAEALQNIKSGERRRVRCFNEAGEANLTLGCSEITLDKRRLRVVTVSDIRDELSERETESWNKLTRILTHEIMNSLAPITSLSDSLRHHDRALDPDVSHGLDTISATSRRLTAFVETFRRFTKIPAPQKRPFGLKALVDHAVTLCVSGGKTVVRTRIEPADTMIYADETLVSQVVMNLLKNAQEAIDGRTDGVIEIASHIDAQENVVVEISNNAGAIPPEVAENIFTPFFTTKRDGSGIGLSVSRQIMQLHNGSLRLSANSDRKVTFTLVFG